MKKKLHFLFIMILAVFMTPNIANSQLLTESFEGTFPPTGWLIVNNGSGNDWTQNTSATYASDGSKSMKYGYNSSNDADTWAFTNGLSLTNGQVYNITFDYRVTGYPEKLKVTVGNAQTVASQTTTLWDNNGGSDLNNTSFAQASFQFTATSTGTFYFAFNCYSLADEYNLFVDNIVIDVPPACPAPTNPTITSLSTTGAQLNWTSGGSTHFNVEYGPIGFTQGTGTMLSIATDTFAVLSNLTAATSYDWYVRDSCNATDISTWVGPNTFKTDYIAISSFPWSDGFETGNTDQNDINGWYQESVSGSDNWTANSSKTTYNRSPRSGSFNAYLGYGNTDWMFVRVNLTGGTTYKLSFWARQDATSGCDILASYGTSHTDAGMTNSIIASSAVTNGDYQEFTGMFTPLTTGIYYVGIKAALTSSPWYISLDDIKIGEVPANDIEVSQIIGDYGAIGTDNYTVKVNIKNNGTVANVVPINYSLDGGAVVSETTPSVAAFSSLVYAFTTPVNSGTVGTHQLAVYSTLAGDADLSNDTAYANVVNLALPYENDFEAYTDGDIPPYWTVLNTTGSNSPYAYVKHYTTTSYVHSGSNCFKMYNSSKTTGDLIASLPKVSGGVNNLRLVFWLKGGGSNLIVGVMSNPNDASTFVGVDTIVNPATTYNQYAVYFASYTGSGTYIALKHGMNGTYDSFYIDDIKLYSPPANDIEVAQIIGDYGAIGNSNYTIKAIINNNGTAAQTAIPISYTLDNGAATTESISSLAAFSTDTFTFAATVNSGTVGTHQLAVYSTLAGDADLSNDTAYANVVNLALPYENDFEAYTDGDIPQYWKVVNATGSSNAYVKIQTSSAYAHSGNMSLKMYNSSSTTGDLLAVMPKISANINSLRLLFWARGTSSDLIVGTMSDPNDTSTFSGFDTLTNLPSSPASYAVYFGSYTGSAHYIAFKHGQNTTNDYINIDDINLYVPPTNEVQITKITRDYGGFGVPTNDTVTVLVRNNGSSAQTALPISYQLDNGTVVTENMPSLAAFSTDTFTFAATFDASAAGKHGLMVYTNLSGDENNSNDTMYKNFITYGTHIIPFTEGFENGYTYFENATGNTTNYVLNTDLAHSGNYSVHDAYAASSDDVLHETGAMDLTSSTTPVLDFWQIAKTESGWDKCYIEISTNNGTSWSALPDSLYLGESSNYASKGYFDETAYAAWSNAADNSMWKMERFSLAAYKDDSVRVRFKLHSDSGIQKEGWYLDDITVQEEPAAVADLGNDTTICAGSTIDLISGSAVGYTFLWTVNGATLPNTTSSINTDSSGTYTVEARGIATVAYDTIVVTVASLPTVSASILGNDTICAGDSTQVNLNFTGASPWNFDISTGSSTFSDSSLSATYQPYANPDTTTSFTVIHIVDGNGCVQNIHSDTNTITVNNLPVVAISTLNDVCESTSAFTLTGGSPANGTYSGLGVNTSASTFDASVAGSGNHNVTYTYTDANGCTDSATTIQKVNALPIITATAGTNPVPYNNSTTLNAAVSNAVGALSYAWTPTASIDGSATLQTVNTINITTATTYVVDITDATTSCQNTDTVSITYSGGPISVNPIAVPSSICAGDTALLKAQSSGGNGSISYTWTSIPSGFSSSLENPNASPTVNTKYIVVATDGANTTTDTIELTILAAPTASFATDTTFICFGNSANNVVNFTGTAPYSYTHNGIIVSGITAATDTFTVSPSVGTDYQITNISDGNGCSSSGILSSTYVGIHNLPSISLSGSDTMCLGDSTLISLDFTGAAPFDFIVKHVKATGISSDTAYGFQYNNTLWADDEQTTVHYITQVKDANGCEINGTNLDSVYIVVNPLPTYSTSAFDTICYGDSATMSISLTGLAPYHFGVDINGFIFTDSSATSTFTRTDGPSTTSVYSINTLIDANGCAMNKSLNTDSIEIYVRPLPTKPTFTGLAAAYCEDAASAVLTPSILGGIFSGTGVSASAFSPSTAGAGSYDIVYTITDTYGCVNGDTNSTIVNALPSINISGLSSAYCANDMNTAIIATPIGGTFSGAALTASDEFSPSTLGAGSYTIYYSYTDGNSCSNMDSAMTIVNALPSITMPTLSPVCIDAASFALTGASPAGGNWMGTAVTNNSFNPSTAGAGSFFLSYTYTDANNCTNSDSAAQVVNALPVLSVSGLATEYCQNNAVDTLVTSPAGGTLFGPGISGNTFNPTVAGAGQFSLLYFYTDANGCFNSINMATTVHSIPTLMLRSDTTICATNNTTLDAGSFNAYLWNTGATTQTITVDSTGLGIGTFNYSVMVTDQNNCTNDDSVAITFEAAPLSQLMDTASTCGEGTSLTLDAGANTSYSYLWSNGATTSSVNVDTTILGGTINFMYVTLTSPAGCATNDSALVYFREAPVVNLGNDTNICWTQNITFDAGTGFTSYLWSTGATTQTINVDSLSFNIGSNEYTVRVMNSVQCSGSDSINLVVDPCTGIPTPELSSADIRIFPNPSRGLFQIDISGLENTDYDLSIYNSIGSKVFGDKVNYSGQSKKSWKIDLSTYSKGIYFVRLQSKGQIKVKRIIIQ